MAGASFSVQSGCRPASQSVPLFPIFWLRRRISWENSVNKTWKFGKNSPVSIVIFGMHVIIAQSGYRNHAICRTRPLTRCGAAGGDANI